MKKILIIVGCVILAVAGVFAWRLFRVHKTNWDSCIIYDYKEHWMQWRRHKDGVHLKMHIQLESKGVDPATGNATYRIHAHTWKQQEVLDFVSIMLMNKDIYDVRMTNIKYNGFWDDVDLWFEGVGDFAIDLIWDTHYWGFAE